MATRLAWIFVVMASFFSAQSRAQEKVLTRTLRGVGVGVQTSGAGPQGGVQHKATSLSVGGAWGQSQIRKKPDGTAQYNMFWIKGMGAVAGQAHGGEVGADVRYGVTARLSGSPGAGAVCGAFAGVRGGLGEISVYHGRTAQDPWSASAVGGRLGADLGLACVTSGGGLILAGPTGSVLLTGADTQMERASQRDFRDRDLFPIDAEVGGQMVLAGGRSKNNGFGKFEVGRAFSPTQGKSDFIRAAVDLRGGPWYVGLHGKGRLIRPFEPQASLPEGKAREGEVGLHVGGAW